MNYSDTADIDVGINKQVVWTHYLSRFYLKTPIRATLYLLQMSTATVSETLGVKQRKSRKSKNDTFLPASTPGVPRISREPNGEHLTIGCSKEGIVLVHSIDNTNEDSAEQKPMKEKKRKRTTEEAQVEKSDDAQSKKKSRSEKVFKRERKEGRKERSGQAQAPDDKLELEKKKKRNRNVNLPDPEDDTSLTDQAHRGEQIMGQNRSCTAILTRGSPLFMYQVSHMHFYNLKTPVLGNLAKLDRTG